MAFDPDAFLEKKKAERMAQFDPDAFLQSRGVKEPATLKENIQGAAETVATVGTGMAGALGGGLAYIPTALMAGDDAGQAVMRGVQEQLTYQPRTARGQEFVGNVADVASEYVAEPIQRYSERLGEEELARSGDPLRATAEYMGPQIALELAGLFLPGQLAKVARMRGERVGSQAARGQRLDAMTAEAQTDLAKAQQAADILSGAKPQELAQMIDADPKIINAIDELGIDAEAPLMLYSQNPQTRSIMSGLASEDGSLLNLEAEKFVSEFANKADEIIETYGGTKQIPELSDSITQDMLKTIDRSYEAETRIYDQIREALPKNTRFIPENTIALIDDMADEVGGLQNLDKSIQKLYKELVPAPKKSRFSLISGRQEVPPEPPTFGLIDQNRKLIGQQLGRKDSPFSGAEERQLKRLYASLKADQSAALTQQGDPNLVNLQQSADRITIQRKRLEQDAKDLLGKNLDKELMNTFVGATKGLEKYKVNKFLDTLDKIPKNRREEAVLSALGQAWKGTAASKQQLGEAQFARFWRSLEQSPKAKEALLGELKPEARRAVENFAQINQAIYRANQKKITTGRMREFMQDRGGATARLVENLTNTRYGRMVASNMPQEGLAGDAIMRLTRPADANIKAANQLLSDPTFKRMVISAVENDVNLGKPLTPQQKRIEKQFMKSEKFKRWADTLDEAQQDRLVTVGVINYLLSPKMDMLQEEQQ